MVATGSPRSVARRVGRWLKHRYPENETLVVRVQAHIERVQLCVSSVREIALADSEFREITDHVALTGHKAAVRDALADLISREEPTAPTAPTAPTTPVEQAAQAAQAAQKESLDESAVRFILCSPNEDFF